MRIKINIPDKLGDIKLDQYQKFLEIQENEKDQFVIGSKMIEIFCEVPYGNIIEYRLSHINKISKKLSSIFKQETKKIIKHFKINNIEYGFLPELDEMTFGEYVDLDTNFKDWQNIHKSMNVLYRPITQKYTDRYNIQKYNGEDADKMKDNGKLAKHIYKEIQNLQWKSRGELFTKLTPNAISSWISQYQLKRFLKEDE